MSYSIKPYTVIEDIGSEAWDRCANPATTAYDPFVSYAFLHALEKSGSACPETGWAPYHLVLEHTELGICGVVPMYLKSHSQGEYVFDHSWADAFERAGGRYYPKLQIAIPFTPVTGRRLLVAASPMAADHEKQLVEGIKQVAENLNVSSVHVTFANEHQYNRMGEQGYLLRTHNQFHWLNADYQNFDDFLGQLSAKKRKNIRRERREAQAHGLIIECLTGTDILEVHWQAFYKFYIDTGNRKWGSPYLTREFFSMIGANMNQHILLVMVKDQDRYIAGAINFIGGDCLYGRNWGCIEHYAMLHFEVCYYQAIEFAIKRGLQRVEAGAQGDHKLARGYLPTRTYSAHSIVNPSFSNAVGDFLDQERMYVEEEIETISLHSPFKSVSNKTDKVEK